MPLSVPRAILSTRFLCFRSASVVVVVLVVMPRRRPAMDCRPRLHNALVFGSSVDG